MPTHSAQWKIESTTETVGFLSIFISQTSFLLPVVRLCISSLPRGVHRCSIRVQQRKIQRFALRRQRQEGEKGPREQGGWDRGGLILNPGDWRGLDETRGDEKPRNTRWYWRAEWRQIKTHSSDATIRHPIQLSSRCCFGSRAFDPSFADFLLVQTLPLSLTNARPFLAILRAQRVKHKLLVSLTASCFSSSALKSKD